MIGASTGLFGAVWAQAEVRKVATAMGANVIDRELPVGQAADAFTEEGRLADDDLELVLADLLAELIGEVRERRRRGRLELRRGDRGRRASRTAGPLPASGAARGPLLAPPGRNGGSGPGRASPRADTLGG